MLKIKVEGTVLKGIIEKALCNMDKKASWTILRKVLLTSEKGALQAITNCIDSYLNVTTQSYDELDHGSVGIDEEDLKVLLKMTGSVEITELEDSIVVKNGKRTISLMKHDMTDFPLIDAENYEDRLTMKECEFAETLNNLSVFTSQSENNKVMQCIHIDLMNNQIEALDGHRIGIRTIDDTEKISDGKLLLHSDIVSKLKKAITKKTCGHVLVSEGKKYNRVSGKDFIFYQRKIDGNFFDIKNMFSADYEFSFNISTNKMLEHIKYYTENVIVKTDKIPLLFKFERNKMTTYGKNMRFEVSDSLDVKNHTGKDITIGFNPWYIQDALKIADSENVIIQGNNSKAPIVISADKYSFLVLPVNANPTYIECMEKYLNKVSAA